MPAFIHWPHPDCRHGGQIRIGPEAHKMWDPWQRFLAFDVDGDIAVIGGLNWKLSRSESRDIKLALAGEGLRPAMERKKSGRKKYRVMLKVPTLKENNQ